MVAGRVETAMLIEAVATHTWLPQGVEPYWSRRAKRTTGRMVITVMRTWSLMISSFAMLISAELRPELCRYRKYVVQIHLLSLGGGHGIVGPFCEMREWEHLHVLESMLVDSYASLSM